MTVHSLKPEDQHFMLTKQQVHHFRTFGFLLLRDVLKAEEIQNINAEFDAKLAMTSGARSNGEKVERMSWSSLGPETPFTSSLLEDSRIISIVESLFDVGFFGISCNASSMVGETNWHPDADNLNMHGLKVLCYLQPLNGNNGALRVIPGSHLNSLHDDIKQIEMNEPRHDGLTQVAAVSTAGLDIEEVPACACTVNPGDLVVFDFRLWHASSGGPDNRRMISMIFIKDAQTPEEEKAVNESVLKSRRNRAIRAKAAFGKPKAEYHPDWVANPEHNPMRQRWIDWLREKGYFEAYDASLIESNN